MSRPWMPLYVSDYLGDTRRLTTLEHGAYLLLIMEYWQHGGLPTDEAELADIAGLQPEEWERVRPRISRLFQDGWRHKRVDAELAKAAEISDRRKASGQAGGRSKWGSSLASENAAKRSERLAAARAIARHSSAEWQAMLELFPQCVRCGDDGQLVKDHIIPIYQGGSDGIDNIQPLCRTCNASKGPEDKDFRTPDWSERLAKRLAIVCDSPSNSLARAGVPQPQPQPHTSSLRSDVTRERASSAASDFERFWSVWPNKVGKPAAAKAFFRVRSECEAIIEAVPRYVTETQAAGRPWLNPATFLNQRRWEDSPAPQPMARAGPSQSNRNGFAALAKKLYGNGDGTRTQNGIPDRPLLLLPVDGDGERGTSGADDDGLPRKAFVGFG
jgi:uncharacterized protein YdaU (DUF1376 family)